MLKVSFLFHQVTGEGRVGGWSETWYFDGSTTETTTAAQQYVSKRAATLTTACKVVGMRVQTVGAKGTAFPLNAPGTALGAQDIPQMALNCSVQGSGTQNIKFFQLRGVPDTMVSQGDYTNFGGYSALITQFFTTLINQGFRFRAINLASPKVRLLSVSSAGVFRVAPGITFNVGDILDFMRVRSTTGERMSGQYYVGAKIDNENGTILNWNGATISMNGQARKRELIYPQIQVGSPVIKNITTRAVGRPFFQYRGRQTRR